MCGIAGIIDFNGLTEESRLELKSMTNRISHRGPDNEGVYFSNHVCFGHRRLSIIDLSDTANQPMTDLDGNIVVCFNGEIFNHAEIRKELEKKHQFKTDHSDTEVIVYAYKEWGIDCLSRFTGQFAIALYDLNTREVFFARDRIGQKPIYYTNTPKGLYFASEASALFEVPHITKEISSEAVYDYLTFLTTKAPKTFYKDIYKVEAGTYLKFTSAGSESHQYWNVADYLNKVSNDSEDKAVSLTEELLDKSMFYRNVSDAPISFALSGGLDSSLNLYYSKKINSNIQAINIAYETDNPYNEDRIAKRFCEDENLPISSITVNSDVLEKSLVDYLNTQVDVPIGDPNSVLMFLLSKKSRELGRNVLMVGEGGDEIGGYPKYLKHAGRQRLLSKAPWLFKTVFNNGIYDLKKLDLYWKNNVVSGAHIHGFTESEKRQFWTGGSERNSFEVLWSTMTEVNTGTSDEYLRRIINLEYKLRLPEMILARIDYPSMASSIEARSPFVDHKLIEYSCTLPFDLKMKNGQAKYLIRKLASNKLPDYILNAPKVGFGQLLTPFLNTTLPTWFKNEIVDSVNAPIKSYVDTGFLDGIYQNHLKTQRHGFKMWVLYALNRWLIINLN